MYLQFQDKEELKEYLIKTYPDQLTIDENWKDIDVLIGFEFYVLGRMNNLWTLNSFRNIREKRT